MKILAFSSLLLLSAYTSLSFAAIGCTLSNPAEDLKYLFPDMTSYKEELKEFKNLKDGTALYGSLKERIGSDLDPIFESFETPYTVYGVFKGEKKVGVIHGVNVPGRGGVIQVFLSTDPGTGMVKKMFFQRLESPAATQLRSKDFISQFVGLTLADFYKHDYYATAGASGAADKIKRIKSPSTDSKGQPDFEASLRGVRKNLVLLDLFVYGRRNDPFFEKAQQALKGKKAGAK